MTPFVQSITSLFSVGALVFNAITIILLAVWVAQLVEIKNGFINATSKFVSKYALSLYASVAIIGTLGSLFYSMIAGFIPCTFCWYARVLLFSQAVIFAIAWYRTWMHKVASGEVLLYGGVLSLIGSCITFYHYYGQRFNQELLGNCEAAGVSCGKLYFVNFGYITLPFLAFTIFILLTSIALIKVTDR
jgi:disulfide bond formation protein DsbB